MFINQKTVGLGVFPQVGRQSLFGKMFPKRKGLGFSHVSALPITLIYERFSFRSPSLPRFPVSHANVSASLPPPPPPPLSGLPSFPRKGKKKEKQLDEHFDEKSASSHPSGLHSRSSRGSHGSQSLLLASQPPPQARSPLPRFASYSPTRNAH